MLLSNLLPAANAATPAAHDASVRAECNCIACWLASLPSADQRWGLQVSDFGLSRVAPSETAISTNTCGTVRVSPRHEALNPTSYAQLQAHVSARRASLSTDLSIRHIRIGSASLRCTVFG